MAIEKKLVCFKTQAKFDAQLAAGNIKDYSIVFIKDTQKIWTHGTYFTSLSELLSKINTKQDKLTAGTNITISTSGSTVTIAAKDTTYTLALADNSLQLKNQDETIVTAIDLTKYTTDTKNTAGATQTSNKLYIIGAPTQTANPETNTSGAYLEDGKVYDANGDALATEESVEAVVNSIEELRNELEITATTTTTYCFMVRSFEDADPTAKRFYGKQENIKNVAKHFRMAAVRKQGDYNLLAPNRLTLDEDGNAISIDGSDGDILCATDAKIYLYAEKIDATDGSLEIFGVGLVPLTLFGKEAVGYDPFAFACDAAVYAKLTSSNTDHIATDDVRQQLHCIYNENVAGQYSNPTAMFKDHHKANGNGYANGSYSTLSNLLHAQAKNEDANTCYPYLGLYYRFVEIWMAAAKCEFGTMDISAIDKLGAGITSTSAATAGTFADTAISANSGCKIMTADGTVKYVSGYRGGNIKVTSTSNQTQPIYGIDGTGGYAVVSMMTPQRVIDKIVAKGNLGYIGTSTNVFDEDGELHTDVNVSTGENMESSKEYYVVRGCDGVESFADGVMTGVVNVYIKQEFIDGVTYSDGTDLTGGCVIFKLSTLLYRGFTWSTSHWIWMQGFHYVIHTKTDSSRYVTCIYQRDPKKLQPWKSGQSYYRLESEGDTDYENGYVKDEIQYKYQGGWAKGTNPSISMFCYSDTNAGQHTYACAYFWRDASWSGNISAGYKSVNGSAIGGSGSPANASAGSLSGSNSVAASNTGFAASFALLDYQKGTDA